MPGKFRNSSPDDENNPVTNEDKLTTAALLLFCIAIFALIFYFLSAT